MSIFDEQLNSVQQSDSRVGEQLRQFHNLESIIRWIPTAGLSLAQFDSIQQDEYNYDIFFPWHDHRWIVFGVT